MNIKPPTIYQRTASRDDNKSTCAVLAHVVVNGYGMSGMAAQARRYMGAFEDMVDTRMVLVIARKFFPWLIDFVSCFPGTWGI